MLSIPCRKYNKVNSRFPYNNNFVILNNSFTLKTCVFLIVYITKNSLMQNRVDLFIFNMFKTFLNLRFSIIPWITLFVRYDSTDYNWRFVIPARGVYTEKELELTKLTVTFFLRNIVFPEQITRRHHAKIHHIDIVADQFAIIEVIINSLQQCLVLNDFFRSSKILLILQNFFSVYNWLKVYQCID